MSSKQLVIVVSLLLTTLLFVTGCAVPAAAPTGGETAALDALFQAYGAANPDVEIVNATVSGGGGSAAGGVLQTRLAGGDVT